MFIFMFGTDFNFEFKQNQNERPSNVCEDQPRYSNSFQNVPSFNTTSSMNGASTGNNGNVSYSHELAL